jgi:DNA-binding MarR family transcriptional regulator
MTRVGTSERQASAPAGAAAPRPDDLEAATRLADTVGRLVRALRRTYVGTMGPASAAALATLVRRGPLRLGELADVEGVTPAALSRVVAGLERDGLVERRADPADRRSAFVEATPRGRTAISELLAGRATLLAGRIGALSPADRATLLAGVAVLEQLVDSPTEPSRTAPSAG